MKRRIISYIIVLLIFAFTPSLYPAHAEEKITFEDTFFFPISLERIADDVFEGTAVKTVVFPDGFLYIGENAFKGAFELKHVYIPATTRYIADSAFPSNQDLRIHGLYGSYASEWAMKHRVPFVVDNIWYIIYQNERLLKVQQNDRGNWFNVVNPDRIITGHHRSEDEGISMRPQDRAELYPIDYKFP